MTRDCHSVGSVFKGPRDGLKWSLCRGIIEALSSKKRVLAITRIQLVCLYAHFNDNNDWNLEAVDRLLAPDCMGQKVVGSNPGASEDFSPQNS